ncbi:MAG: phosphatase PAP2 family protein [Bacteroidales bacterium]|nr:phosphatase PAP2 family protein [Bacteroidales bacterium]
MLLLNDFFYSHWFDWDKQLFQFINGHNSPFWDQVMQVITSTQFGLVFCLILSIITFVFYRKKTWKILLFIAVVTLSADAFGARVLKTSIQRLRPSHDTEYHGDYEVHLLQRKDGTYYRGGRYSCPSNHAINYLTTSLLFFYFLSPKVRRKWLLGIFVFGTTLLSCYSRIYVGVHYPTDILFGWLIAVLIAGLATWLEKRFNIVEPSYYGGSTDR